MAQPNAQLTVVSNVRLIPGTSTPNVPSDQSFNLTTTVGNYANDTAAYATSIWNFLVNSGYQVQATPTTVDQLTTSPVAGSGAASLEAIDYLIEIANVTAPAPNYESAKFSPEKEARGDGSLGPADFSNIGTLQAALNSAIQKVVAQTNY